MSGSLHFNIISPAIYFLHAPFFSTDCMLLIFFFKILMSYIYFKKKILIASACLFRIIKKKNNVNFPILLFCYLIFQIDLTNFEEHNYIII